jgi:hypothetical protein
MVYRFQVTASTKLTLAYFVVLCWMLPTGLLLMVAPSPALQELTLSNCCCKPLVQTPCAACLATCNNKAQSSTSAEASTKKIQTMNIQVAETSETIDRAWSLWLTGVYQKEHRVKTLASSTHLLLGHGGTWSGEQGAWCTQPCMAKALQDARCLLVGTFDLSNITFYPANLNQVQNLVRGNQ